MTWASSTGTLTCGTWGEEVGNRAITMNTWESAVSSVIAGLNGPAARTPEGGATEGFVHTWEWRS